MRNIYENACEVLLWLGEDEPAARSFKLLRIINDDFTRYMDFISKRPDFDGFEDDCIDYFSTRHAQEICTDFRNNDRRSLWKPLQDLFFNPWWKRGWITQEVIVARNAIILCHDQTISWNEFRKSFLVVWKISRELGDRIRETDLDFDGQCEELILPLCLNDQSGFLRAQFMLEKRKLKGTPEMNLVMLLESSRECRVSDSRDKVYALLGLLHPRYPITCDYTETVEQTFRKVCKEIIVADQSLDILSYGQEPLRPLNNVLPSWCPDWTCSKTKSKIISTSKLYGGEFEAPGDYIADYLPLASFQDEDKTLRIHAIVIDQVAAEGKLCLPPEYDMKQAISSWEKIALASQETSQYFTGECVDDVFRNIIWQGVGGSLQLEYDEEVYTPYSGKGFNDRVIRVRQMMEANSTDGTGPLLSLPKVSWAWCRSDHLTQTEFVFYWELLFRLYCDKKETIMLLLVIAMCMAL
jgi:hypothetical protein